MTVIFPGNAVLFPVAMMDDVDRQLLRLLQEDASRPLKTLAAAVGLARSSVRERIVRMRTDGVIRRYTIDTSSERAPLSAVLLVRLARTPDPTVVHAVVEDIDVFRCRSLSGDIDLLVEICGRDVAAINRARDRISQLPGVEDVVTSFVLNQEKG